MAPFRQGSALGSQLTPDQLVCDCIAHREPVHGGGLAGIRCMTFLKKAACVARFFVSLVPQGKARIRTPDERAGSA